MLNLISMTTDNGACERHGNGIVHAWRDRPVPLSNARRQSGHGGGKHGLPRLIPSAN